MPEIKLYGKLVNKTDGIIADSEQVKYKDTTVAEALSELEEKSSELHPNNIIQLEDSDLDNIAKPGVYEITGAKNAEIADSGILTVTEFEDRIKQVWETETGYAFRYGKNSREDFYVDGKVVSPVDGVVELKAGGEYTLSGVLEGSVKIVGDSTVQTTLNLNNVSIISDITAINYTPTAKRLVVNLLKNTVNYLVNTGTSADKSVAVLYSENNMTIKGVGYLSIKDVAGVHGVKASELLVMGLPHIYVEANHDAIHGGSLVDIENGYFYINKAKDGFGTGDDGLIKVFGGYFSVNNVAENIFDSKQRGFIYDPKHSEKITSNISKSDYYNNIKIVSAVDYGDAKVYTYNLDGKTEVDRIDITPDENGVYLLQGLASDACVKASGNLTGKQIKFDAASKKINLYLDNTYIDYSGNGPSIVYLATSSRLKVVSVKDTVNYVIQSAITSDGSDYDAIKSENNLPLELKNGSVLYVSSKLGDGLDGGKCIITDSKGTLYSCNNAERGLKASEISLGADPEDVTAGAEISPLEGNLYFLDNNDSTENADIFARNGSKRSKGTLTIYPDYCTGTIVCNSLASIKGIDLGNYSDFYYSKLNEGTITNTPGEFSAVKDYYSEFPVAEKLNNISGSWTVISQTNIFSSLSEAEKALEVKDYPLGTILSVNEGMTSDYQSNFNPYIVVLNKSGVKVLKVAAGEGGSSSSGSLDFNIESFTIDGVEQVLSADSFECNIGSKLTFKYTFISQYYPDVKGTVYCKLGSSIVNQEKVYPAEGNVYSWTYDTSSLTAGSYTISLYGVESTGKQSLRKTFTLQVGGLNISSNFNQDDILETGKPLQIAIDVAAADSSSEITVHGLIDNKEVVLQVVKPGSSTIRFSETYITEGVHTIKLYLTNIAGKTSNELTFTVVAAAVGKVYAFFDENSYSAAQGAKLEVPIRIVQIGASSQEYTGKLVVKNSSGEVVSLNGKEENKYNLSYGKNIIPIVGLTYSTVDGTDTYEGNEKNYTAYTLNFIIQDAEGVYDAVSAKVDIKIFENSYDINIIDTDLLCWFEAEGKTNSDDDRESWTDKSGNNVTATFNNFNWKTNGWIKDDDGDTALTLNANSYVELDITPFQNGPENLTISVDFETADILDSEAKVVSCLYEYSGNDLVSYYLRDSWGDYIKTDSTENLDVSFKDLTVDYLDDENNKNAVINLLIAGKTDAEKEEIMALTNDKLLEAYIEKRFESVNNIKRYFMFAGGYCWVDGNTYVGDGTTPYEVTYAPSDRILNYNKGDVNTSYSASGDKRKYTGTVSEPVTKQQGFYIDTQYGVLSNSSSRSAAEDKFHMNFSENTRTRMDFLINRSEEKPYYIPSMVGYVNGVISSMQEITTDDKFEQQPQDDRKFKIYLGGKAVYDDNGKITISDTGRARIYSFKIYNRCLSHEEIVRNYAASITDQTEKQNVIDNNGVLDKNILPKLPQLCLMGAKIGEKYTITDFIMQLANASESNFSDLKAIKEPAYISYIDPNNTANNWTTPDGDVNIPIRLQFQGTSSLVYPVKNYKFKMYDGFTIESTGKVTYGSKIKRDIGNGIKENTFCLKADYMNSSHTNNTGAANFISDYNEVTGTTPASSLDSRIRTTVYGYPVLLYYKLSKDDPDTEKQFLGVYNLNLDKSDTDSFGLDKEVKDSEEYTFDFEKSLFIDDEFGQDILKKTDKTVSLYDSGDAVYKDYTVLENADGLAVAALSEKGYIRSLGNDSISNTVCYELKANSGASGAGGFGNYFINSVANDVEPRYPDDGDLEDEEYAAYQGIAGSSALTFKQFKSPWFYHLQRLIKWIKNADEEEFVKNIDRHFNRNYLMDYYLTILLLGGVDSLGKNLMIGTWGPENRLYTTSEDSLDPASENYDSKAFKYTEEGQEPICVTPTRNKTMSYEKTNSKGNIITYYSPQAKNSKGLLLFYSEDCYDRFNEKFRDGYSSYEVTTVPGECIWYPTFYDIDTILGVDNSGQLLYDVDIELGDQLEDGTAVFNTADSHLWTKVKDYLGAVDDKGDSLLSDRWSVLRREKFTSDNLVGKFFYEREIKQIPESYYNKDCFLKYVFEGPEEKVGSRSYLYCCHGSSYEQIKRWVSQRIYYLDSMFGKVGRTNASLRFNHTYYDANFGDTDGYYNDYSELAAKYPDLYEYDYNAETDVSTLKNKLTSLEIKPIEFKFKTYQPGYVGVRWFNGGATHYTRVKRNGESSILGNVKTSGDAEVFIFGGENIKEIGDMSPYNSKQVDFRNLTKLNKLQLGSSENKSVINKLDLGNNTYLSDLILTNCTSLTTINVSGCENLRNVNMTGSGITNITLPDSGALESISYSNYITNINLKNFINLSSITTPSLGNLTSLVIENCPKILGSRESPTARAWSLLQQTYNTSSLTTIKLTSYGTVEPRVISSSEVYFFPDKYYSYSTAKNIKGEIYYTGTSIPTNYIRFTDAFPNLTITYNNITDVSNMFANYNNLKCINKIQVDAGMDIYGKPKYEMVYYWTDETEELQNKWHTQEVLSKYGSSDTYSVGISFYLKDGKSYRLIDLYDDEDLDILRAEIKESLSHFKKFTNMSGLFKGIKVLDYLDPDTFNSIDISEAKTDEMFSGCTKLKYFELPNDTVKNDQAYTYYNYDEEKETWEEVDYTNWDEQTGKKEIKEGYYVNPFTNEETTETTSTYKKGMRTIGSKMFQNCQKVKVYIRNYSGEKVSIASDAFQYNIYVQNSSNYTYERPVVLFEASKQDLLITTSDAKVSISGVEYDNIPTGTSGLYYLVDEAGRKQFNTGNDYILLYDVSWIREAYFGVSKVVMSDTTSVDGFDLFYAENADGKIIFDVKGTGKVFNKADGQFSNSLNVVSVTSGAFENASGIESIESPLPEFECLSTVYPLYSEEQSFVNILTTKTYTADGFASLVPGTLKSVYICRSSKIPNNCFAYFGTITRIGLDKTIETIGDSAFLSFSSLTNVVYSGNLSYPSTSSKLKTIGTSAFAGCTNLTSFDMGDSVTEIGNNAFESCTNLKSLVYSNSLTYIPDSLCMSDTNLTSFTNISKNITKIGKYAFNRCSSLNVFNSPAQTSQEDKDVSQGLSFFGPYSTENFEAFTKLETIDDYAFYGVTTFVSTATSRSLLQFNNAIKYIGISAFDMSSLNKAGNVELEWVGDLDTDFTELVIETAAFNNMRICWKLNNTIINSCISLPKLSYIGSNVFKLNQEEFNYVFAKNSEDEIGSEWVNNPSKIVFNYFDTYDAELSGYKYGYKYLLSTTVAEGYNGIAYIKEIIQTQDDTPLENVGAVEIPEYVEYTSTDGTVLKFKILEILSGAFDAITMTSLIFDKNSKIEKLESGVLTSSSLALIMTGDVSDVIPETLYVESGNDLKKTTWFTLRGVQGEFTVLGKNIIGYTFPEDSSLFSGELDLTIESLSGCDTVFDNAFSGESKITSVKFGSGIKYIHQNAFKDTGITSIELPNSLQRIATSAFEGCVLEDIVIPENVSFIGENVFTGVIKSFDIKERAEGVSIPSRNIFKLDEDITTNVTSTNVYPAKVNGSLKTLHIPNGMAWMLSSDFNQYRIMSQITHLYLGSLEVNDDSEDANYGTYYVKNYPLYKSDEDGTSVGYTETEYPYTDDSGNQIYVPRIYHNIGLGTKGFKEDYSLTTTEKYSICPKGDFSGSIDLKFIRKYENYSPSDYSGLTEFTREDLFRILAGLSIGSHDVEIRKADFEKLSTADIVMLAQYGINIRTNLVVS